MREVKYWVKLAAFVVKAPAANILKKMLDKIWTNFFPHLPIQNPNWLKPVSLRKDQLPVLKQIFQVDYWRGYWRGLVNRPFLQMWRTSIWLQAQIQDQMKPNTFGSVLKFRRGLNQWRFAAKADAITTRKSLILPHVNWESQINAYIWRNVNHSVQ